MFKDKKALHNFIFNKNCFIATGNDNSDWDERMEIRERVKHQVNSNVNLTFIYTDRGNIFEEPEPVNY